MEASIEFSNSLFFNDEKQIKVNDSLKNGFIISAIGLGSFFAFSNTEQISKIDTQLTLNTISSIHISNEENYYSIPIISKHQDNTVIIDMNEKEESEGLNVEELRKLQESFDRFSIQNHEQQLKVTELLSTLNTEMSSVKNELLRLNKAQDELPSTIQKEIKSLSFDRLDDNKKVWIAPIIVGVVVGLILLAGQYFLGL